MFERFTASARRAVVLAQEEARMLNHDFVNTEHLLLALTHDNGTAGKTLLEAGVTTAAVRAHVIETIGEGSSPVNGHIVFLPPARAALLKALRCALGSGVNYINPAHILQSLLTEDTSSVPVAQTAITACGANAQDLLNRLLDLMTEPSQDAEPGPAFVLSA